MESSICFSLIIKKKVYFFSYFRFSSCDSLNQWQGWWVSVRGGVRGEGFRGDDGEKRKWVSFSGRDAGQAALLRDGFSFSDGDFNIASLFLFPSTNHCLLWMKTKHVTRINPFSHKITRDFFFFSTWKLIGNLYLQQSVPVIHIYILFHILFHYDFL